MRKQLTIALLLFINACAFSATQHHPVKILFWHSLAGKQGYAIGKIVHDFNASQHKYQIEAVYKGDYNTTLTELIAAYRAHKQPALSQVLEVGTGTMLAAKPAIVPLYQLMHKAGYPKFSQKLFIPAVAGYYSDAKGRLMSFPINSSSPVLYYNKQAFKKAGLNPNKPPKTWLEVGAYGKKILKAGYQCAFTTTWPSWIQLEEFSAWHNIPYATEDNGFKGFNVKALFNNPLVLRQVATLTKWGKSGIFEYGGRGDDAQSLFLSGHCAMMTQSSGARGSIMGSVKFPVGVAAMPYWSDVKGAPQNSIIGGASLWAMSGFSPQVYKGVAAFIHYLMNNKVQEFWQKETGYIVVTKAGYKAAVKSGYYKRNPGSDIPIKELTNKPPTKNSKGIRLGNYLQIRISNNTALEAAFSGQMSPKKALKFAVKRADRLLNRFTEMTGGKE